MASGTQPLKSLIRYQYIIKLKVILSNLLTFVCVNDKFRRLIQQRNSYMSKVKNILPDSLVQIKTEPYMLLRMQASKLLLESEFKKEHFEKLLEDVMSESKNREFDTIIDKLSGEISQIRYVLAGNPINFIPNLSHPSMQLLWGALLMADILPVPQGQSLEQTAHWKAVIDTKELNEYLQFHAFYLVNHQGVKDGKIKFGPPTVGTKKGGYPAVGFYFSPSFNFCNLDPAWGLFLGLKDSTAAVWHEIKHAEGTRETVEQKRVRAQMKVIKDQLQPRTPDDHKRLGELALENTSRHSIFDVTENNYTNGFLPKLVLGEEKYKGKINRTIAGILGFRSEEDRSTDPKWQPGYEPTASERFEALRRSIDFCFYQSNEMFPDTSKGWHSMDIHREWVKATITKEDGDTETLSTKKSFRRLQKYCKKLQETQPLPKDRLMGDAFYNNKVERCTQKRNRITDQIFKEFASDILKDLTKEAQEQSKSLKDQMDKLKDMQQQIRDMDETGRHTPGQEQGGDQQQQGGDQQQGGSPNGQKQKVQVGEPGEKLEEMDEVDSAPDENALPKGMTQEQLEESFKEAENIQKAANKKAKGKSSQDDKEKSADKDANGEEQQSDQQKDEKANHPPSARKFEPSPLSQGSIAAKRDGDLNAYAQLIAPHDETIARVKTMLEQIQETQKMEATSWTGRTNKSKMPGIKGVDLKKVKHLVNKSTRGREITHADRQIFKAKEESSTPPPIDFVFLLDLSGSIQNKFDLLLATTAIFYEAAKDNPGFKVTIIGMGDPEPSVLAKTGDSEQEITASIERTRSQLGGAQDKLEPALKKGLELTMDPSSANQSAKVGATHVFVISDGFFTDNTKGLELLQKVTDETRYVTLDCVLIKTGSYLDGNAPIEQWISEGKFSDSVAHTTIDFTEFDTKIGGVLEDILKQRMDASKDLHAISFNKKIRAVESAYSI